VGATTQEKFDGSTLQGENPRSGRLNWLCLALALLKALFCQWGFFSRVKPRSIDRATAALVRCYHCSGTLHLVLNNIHLISCSAVGNWYLIWRGVAEIYQCSGTRFIVGNWFLLWRGVCGVYSVSKYKMF
jgi:hypothetical protein